METNGHVLEDEASPPELSPRPPQRPARSLFFRSPETVEELPPAPRTSPEAPDQLAAEEEPTGSASEPDWTSDDSSEAPASDPTSSSTSSAKSPLKPLGKAALKATTAKAVLIGSAMAHRVAARTEGQRSVGLYLADQEDADNIGEPVASILSRRGGIAGKEVSPDTADALAAMMGLANYVSKQVVRLQQAHEVDEHLAAGGTLDV